MCELNSVHTHTRTHARTHTHTVSSAHSESANGVNRDGGRFIDNHQIFVNMKDLHWCVQHLCDNHPRGGCAQSTFLTSIRACAYI